MPLNKEGIGPGIDRIEDSDDDLFSALPELENTKSNSLCAKKLNNVAGDFLKVRIKLVESAKKPRTLDCSRVYTLNT